MRTLINTLFNTLIDTLINTPMPTGCIPRFGDDKERLDLCRSFVQDICRSLDAADRSREEVRAKIKK